MYFVKSIFNTLVKKVLYKFRVVCSVELVGCGEAVGSGEVVGSGVLVGSGGLVGCGEVVGWGELVGCGEVVGSGEPVWHKQSEAEQDKTRINAKKITENLIFSFINYHPRTPAG